MLKVRDVVAIMPNGERLYEIDMFDKESMINAQDSAIKERSPLSPVKYINDLIV